MKLHECECAAFAQGCRSLSLILGQIMGIKYVTQSYVLLKHRAKYLLQIQAKIGKCIQRSARGFNTNQPLQTKRPLKDLCRPKATNQWTFDTLYFLNYSFPPKQAARGSLREKRQGLQGHISLLAARTDHGL